MLRFNPSPYSYGQAEAAPAAPADPTAPAPAAPAEGGAEEYLSYIPVIGSLTRQILGVSDSPEEIRAKIENYEKQMAVAPASPLGMPVPGTKNWYLNELNKLKAKLQVSEAERAKAQLQDALKFLALGTGVVILGAIAVNQVQKARIQQAELVRLRGSA